MTTDQPIDVAIIGGGPAGYAAAIYAARSNLTTTVIEQGMSGGQIATTNEVENYPGIPLLSGAELGERFQQHAEGLGAQVAWSMVTGIDYDADAALFTVHHDMGDTLASSVIACMGATPRPAGFAGEDTYRGRGVSYCATCDGMFFRGKQVFVIGGGNSACEEALFLSDIASSATTCCAATSFVRLMVLFRKYSKRTILQLGTKLVLWSFRAKPCQRRSPLRTMHPVRLIPSHLNLARLASLSLRGRSHIPSLLSISSIWLLTAALSPTIRWPPVRPAYSQPAISVPSVYARL